MSKSIPKLVDLLDVNKPVAGQSHVIMSFLSPEKILKQKEIFFFEEFLKKWDFNKSMEKYVQFLNFLSYKYNLRFDDLTKDFTEFVEEEKANLVQSDMSDEYKTFLDKNEDALEKSFMEKNSFQTCVRGIKIHRTSASLEEAQINAQAIRDEDPIHCVLVGEVGVWLPWDPEAYKTGRVEYMEPELNALMHEKVKNETNAKLAHEQRVKEAKKKAIEENMKNAEKYGNLLTQTVDKDGNLISVNNLNTQENILLEEKAGNTDEVTIEDIQREMFEGENVVMDKNTDHGKSRLLSVKLD